MNDQLTPAHYCRSCTHWSRITPSTGACKHNALRALLGDLGGIRIGIPADFGCVHWTGRGRKPKL